MRRKEGDIVGVLDIGASKVVCVIAKVIADNSLIILGIGHSPSLGMKAGIVTDMQAVQNSIKTAVQAAQNIAECEIKSLYISVAASATEYKKLRAETSIFGKEINSNDISKLFTKINEKIDKDEYEVIHNFINDYILDGNAGIKNPLGMYGRILSSEMGVIQCARNSLLNLQNCVLHCKLSVNAFISSSVAVGFSCLTEEERQYGAILIDIGSSKSSISFFRNDNILMEEWIPIGGDNVTKDLVQILGINTQKAEILKRSYGSVKTKNDAFNKEIDLYDESGLYNQTKIPVQFMTDIIRARMEEIIEILASKIQNINYSYGKVIITGGGADIDGLTELAANIFKQNTRIGYPCYINGISEDLTSTAYTCVIGMLQYIQNIKRKKWSNNKSFSRKFEVKNLISWLKENF